jgi:hypothetical protein
MNRKFGWTIVVAGLAAIGAGQNVRAEELPQRYQDAINKGLAWLAKTQLRDGHWEASGGAYPVAMTGMSGVALLMEGSTLREGKYADNVRRATDWLMNVTQRNGLISPLNGMGRGYMHDHGYALLFLALVYGDEEDNDRRRHLQDVLTRAVDFTGKAQTPRGGWGYVSSADNGGFDEGSVTVTQVQALRACRNAGVVVPKDIIDKGLKYLKDCTGAGGGVTYTISGGGERPALTAAAIACAFNAGEYDSPLVKRWFKYCLSNLGALGGGRMGHDEYTQYYWAQSVYMLGEEGWAKLFPESGRGDAITWSKYRKGTFDFLCSQQSGDGSWSGSGSWGGIGPVYATAMALTIMQLDNATLPLYQR